MELRNYQISIINEIKRNLKEKRKICVQSACGSGKSVLICKIVNDTTAKGNRVLFLVHRKELIDQIKNTLDKFDVNFDLVDLYMVQTACRRLKKMERPAVIITDENHHCLAASYVKVYKYFENAYLLGFTATPIRLNGEGLEEIYNYMVLGPKINWLIDNNYLAPYKMYSVKLADTSDLHIRAGEFKKDEVTSLMEQKKIYGETIKNYLKLAAGKKTIIYCASVKSSINTANEFNSNNISAKHLDGTTPKNERAEAIQDFRDGKITVLTNVDLFGEGFDVPDCECVILLRPTMSLSLYIQQSMRSMRYKEAKTAIIIDHVKNCFKHGLPDEDRNWTLQGKPKKEKNQIGIRECPACFRVVESGITICPYCGHVFNQNKEKAKAVTVDIELEEINKKDILKGKRFSYIKELKTLREIIDFVEVKKYKPGVIFHQLQERTDIKITLDDLKRFQKFAGYKRGWWTHHAHLINSESEVN